MSKRRLSTFVLPKWSLLLVLAFVWFRPCFTWGADERGEVRDIIGVVQRTTTNGEAMTVTNGMRLDPGDTLTTSNNSTARISYPNNTEIRVRESTKATLSKWFLYLWRGAIRLLSRDGADTLGAHTSHSAAATQGTEYELRATPTETIITLFDGSVTVSNRPPASPAATNLATSGIITVSSLGKISVTNGLAVSNIVQWWLYYPAVVDWREIGFTQEETARFALVRTAYVRGNLRAAQNYFQPTNSTYQAEGEKILYSVLRLAFGEAGDAEAAIEELPRQPATDGLLRLIRAMTVPSNAPPETPLGASGWLAQSYVEQARGNLTEALAAAKVACQLSPDFGFAWARRAELEFSFGNFSETAHALNIASNLAPEFAPIYTLKGFVLAGRNHLTEARFAFLKARDLDPGIGDAWLGLGLLKFRSAHPKDGLNDMRTAAGKQPNRALLRSYFGKAYAENFDGARATKEWDLAVQLDPADPTPWLYRAWEDYDSNRVNTAISELERSISLNDNRALYRSKMLLDEDRAVRGASLARLYLRAGMPEVALREAAVSVSYDYSDPSAHLFLADAFNALRDPTRFNLRYETAWFNEVLLANVLAPVDAGVIAPSLSQQEYTRLFSQDGVRWVSSFGEARSDGQFRQLATHGGIFGRFAYSVDLDWQHNDGTRPNQQLDRTEIYPQFKYQVSDRDTALVLLKFQDYHAGDNFQYLDPTNARTIYKFDELQHPLAIAMWRHEWRPGVQTLALAGRLENDQRFGISNAFTVVVDGNTNENLQLNLKYRGRTEIFVGELQQIARLPSDTLIVGVRAQQGRFDTFDQLTGDLTLSPYFGDTNSTGLFHRADIQADFLRTSFYAYNTIALDETLDLTFGLAREHLELPENFRHPPVAGGEVSLSRLEPKAALVWRPSAYVTLRGMYAQSLGGATLDESYRLEPVQLAGFSQAFRTVIPESLAGSVSGHRLDLAGAALDIKLPTRTYLGLEFTETRSAVDREIGAFAFDSSLPTNVLPGNPIRVEERLRYHEHAAQFTLNQLVGDTLALGAAYRFSRAQLDDRFSFPITPQTPPRVTDADLHQFRASAIVNFPSGWFGRLNATWYLQDSERNFSPAFTHHEVLQQTDLETGWRFPRRLGEISVGALNIFDEDYRLEPLSALPDLSRDRVFFVRLRLNL